MEHLKGNQLSVLIPTDQQREAIDLWLEKGSLLCHGETGSGKTLIGVEGLRELDKPVNLIIGPLHTYTSWARTLKNQTGYELRHINRKNKLGKETEADILNGVPGHYFVGRELFQRIEWNPRKIDVVVFDEIHAISNRKSKTYKASKKMKPVPYKLGLSATPAGNKFEGMYSISKFLFPEEIDNSFWRWVTEWCSTEYDPFAHLRVTGELNPGAFVKSLPAYTFMPSPHQGEVVIKYIDVELTPTQRKMYKALEEESIAWFEDNPTFVDLPATLYMRLMQSVLAVPKITTWEEVNENGEVVQRSTAEFPQDTKSTKIDVFLDLLKDIPEDEALVCFSHSKIFAELLLFRLQKAGHEARIFDKNNTKELVEGLGTDYRILIGTQQSMGEGLDGLQHKSHIDVFFTLSDNMMLNTQAFGRVDRQGQGRAVIRYVIRALNTVETDKQVPRLLTAEEILEKSYGNHSV